jgi:hypothetical protein
MALTKLNNQSLSAVSALPAAISTGGVLQVKYAEIDMGSDGLATTSQTYIDLTGYSIAITPTSTSSKILISYGIHTLEGASTGNWASDWNSQIIRGSTKIYPTTDSNYDGGTYGPTNTYAMKKYDSTYLDTPNTTSEITYKIQVKSKGGRSISFNQYANGHMILMEIAV